MKEKLKKQLKEKGWTKEDINKAKDILEKAESKKKTEAKIIDRSMYWMILLMLIVCNFVLAIILVPLLLLLKPLLLYSSAAIIALCFGFFMDLILRDIEIMDRSHHAIIGLFLPGIAILTIYFMTHAFYNLAGRLGLVFESHHPLIVGFVYAFFFMAPYVYFKHLKKEW